VLVYLAPSTRAFAVIGDSGIHEHCGNDFWEDVAARMGARLREGEPTAALIAAVRTIGARLAEYFPHEPDDRNELPDQIAPG
jgi:uncharacterized membrane protein